MWNWRKIPKSVLLCLALLYGFVIIIILICSNDISAQSLLVLIDVNRKGDVNMRRSANAPRSRGKSLLSSEEMDMIAQFHYDDEIAHTIRYEEANKTMLKTDKDSERGLSLYNMDVIYGKALPFNSRFIFTTQMCAGLGNQMYRFASLYAIGKASNRTPFYATGERCVHDFELEIRDIYPNLYRQIHFFDPPSDSSTRRLQLKNCCRYEPTLVARLASETEQVVQITGSNNLQSYHYFHAIHDEIQDIFRCAPEIIADHRSYFNLLLGGDVNSRKLCVHTRVGDFVPLKIATEQNATSRLIDHALDLEAQKYPKQSIAVILLGQDKYFLKRLRDAKEIERSRRLISLSSKYDAPSPNFYIPREMPRAEDMCFASNACDSLLIASHASTFSFWIGYLMPKGSNVYYNSVFNSSTPYSEKNFPQEWTPLSVNYGKVNRRNNFLSSLFLNRV